MFCIVRRITSADICVSSTYYAREPERSKTYRNDTQRTIPLWHACGISHLVASLASMICQERHGDTSLGGTLRDAIEEIECVSILRMYRASHTSSRDKACLNSLIVVFLCTKGKVLRLTTPTLPTVSLSINRFSIHADQSKG